MSIQTPALLALVFTYLIGAIPFAYLTVRLAKGVDIRSIGSGNVGATNVGRLLGFRYFLLVFLLDFSKGLLPTLIVPWLARKWPGGLPPHLTVQVALAAILGHNFPIYLKFQGGKGVATSLGALAALDPVASGVSVVVFTAVVLSTRYVSLSSIIGACGFVVAHFARQREPWRRENIALSFLTIGLLGLIVIRHRRNIARLLNGTEPKVGRKKAEPKVTDPPRSGKARLWTISAIVVLGVSIVIGAWAMRPLKLDCGPFRLEAIGRVETGEQRAERIVFADGGKLLAVACPRYGRVALIHVDEHEMLKLFRVVPLEGRPVALCAQADKIFILQRPGGDARHVEQAWWETIDLQGNRVGPRVRVGFDPDDLSIAQDGHTAFVLTSGRAEGESNRPKPALIVFDLGKPNLVAREIARLEFNHPGDDPARLTVSDTGLAATVTLLGSNQIAAIDLTDRERPRLLESKPLGAFGVPYVSRSGDDAILMPVDSDRETVRVVPPQGNQVEKNDSHEFLLSILPDESVLEVVSERERNPIGKLSLRGVANLGAIRPAGIAYSPERGLIAVADRQGGGVNLIALRWNQNRAKADPSPIP